MALVVHGQVCRPRSRQIRISLRLRHDAEPFQVKSLIPCCREKPLSVEHVPPVPQTDAGGQVENTKAIGRTVVKELGKIPP